eukprot:scaffold68494_cov31-Tisochrysis_lutea.AAC.2
MRDTPCIWTHHAQGQALSAARTGSSDPKVAPGTELRCNERPEVEQVADPARGHVDPRRGERGVVRARLDLRSGRLARRERAVARQLGRGKIGAPVGEHHRHVDGHQQHHKVILQVALRLDNVHPVGSALTLHLDGHVIGPRGDVGGAGPFLSIHPAGLAPARREGEVGHRERCDCD